MAGHSRNRERSSRVGEVASNISSEVNLTEAQRVANFLRTIALLVENMNPHQESNPLLIHNIVPQYSQKGTLEGLTLELTSKKPVEDSSTVGVSAYLIGTTPRSGETTLVTAGARLSSVAFGIDTHHLNIVIKITDPVLLAENSSLTLYVDVDEEGDRLWPSHVIPLSLLENPIREAAQELALTWPEEKTADLEELHRIIEELEAYLSGLQEMKNRRRVYGAPLSAQARSIVETTLTQIKAMVIRIKTENPHANVKMSTIDALEEQAGKLFKLSLG